MTRRLSGKSTPRWTITRKGRDPQMYVTVGGAKERSFGRKALPCLLALLFGAASLADRNVQELGSLADPARHMLNGALLHDMIQSGQVLHPERFAQQFYSHYPAI